jgi:hypothetical protein
VGEADAGGRSWPGRTLSTGLILPLDAARRPLFGHL